MEGYEWKGRGEVRKGEGIVGETVVHPNEAQG